LKNIISFLQRPFFRYHLPAIMFAVVIFILSSIPKLNPPNLGFKVQDKFYHFVFYGAFGFLVARSFSFLKFSQVFPKKYLFYAILFSVAYGLSDEIHQYYVPGRQCSFGDFLADSIGAIAGIMVYHYCHHLRRFFLKNFSWKRKKSVNI
jgi:VanZ family protein